MLNEKHGYIDPKEFLLNEITEKVYDVITDDSYIFSNWFYYPKSDGVKKYKNDSGISFYTFEQYINSKYLTNIIVTIVRIDNYDTARSKCMQGFIDDKDAGFYQPSTDNKTGYIYLNYNMYKDVDDSTKTDIKDTIYHEMRHFFDDTKNIIPQRKKGTIADQEHYVNVLAENVLDIDIDSIKDEVNSKSDIDYQESFEILDKLVYIMEPTEMNAFYHSLVVQLQKYKEDNPDCTLQEIKKYAQENNHLFFMRDWLDTPEKYKIVVNKTIGKNTEFAVHYMNKWLNHIKHTNDWVKGQNKYFMQTYLNNKDPWVANIEKAEAELAIRKYVKRDFSKLVYKRIQPVLLKTFKNIDKLIVDILIGD